MCERDSFSEFLNAWINLYKSLIRRNFEIVDLDAVMS